MINEVNGVNSDIDKLSNEDLVKIIKKYSINTGNQNLNRSQALQLIKNFIESKQKKKNEVKSISVENRKERVRRMSATNSTTVKRENIPQNDVKHVRDRRMSQPQTRKEVQIAQRDHELKINQNILKYKNILHETKILNGLLVGDLIKLLKKIIV